MEWLLQRGSCQTGERRLGRVFHAEDDNRGLQNGISLIKEGISGFSLETVRRCMALQAVNMTKDTKVPASLFRPGLLEEVHNRSS